MAEINWIKLRVDMFDDDKIKIIQSMPEGDAILVVWIRILALAGKCNAKGLRVYEINFAETKAEEEARRQTRENEQVPPPAPENTSFMDIPEGDGEFPFH